MDIIKTYAPNNANITQEELSGMKDLTDEQIAELAKAYPNQPSGNAYLVLYDTTKKDSEQLYPLNSWQNLHSLRKLGRKEWLPLSFKNKFFAPKKAEPAQQRVVDLSDDEAKGAEGLKKDGSIKNVVIVPAENFEDQSKEPSSELVAARKELQQAIDDKAHHMIVKKLQKTVDELETATNTAK